MEGLELPPVEGARGGRAGTGRFIDPHLNEGPNNEYIKLWTAVYPALKAAVPGVKISAYPSGQGPITTPYFPYTYLYNTSAYKPDFFPFHQYSFAADTVAPQRVLDATWAYTGKFIDFDGSTSSIKQVLQGWGVANPEIGMTEFNYDGGGQYASANSMWDAMYYTSVIANAANSGQQFATVWELFAGSNTDELISDIYTNPTPQLRSEALAMRLLKQFNTANRIVLSNTVTTSDNAVPYDWEMNPITPASIGGKRVECLATSDSTGYKILLINKNVSSAHTVSLNVPGMTTQQATVQVYDSRADLANLAPTTTSPQLAGGVLEVAMPAQSLAVVTVSSGTPPPADTTAPTVSITAPTAGSTVSGSVAIAATAADAGSGVASVEFRADGVLVGTDTHRSLHRDLERHGRERRLALPDRTRRRRVGQRGHLDRLGQRDHPAARRHHRTHRLDHRTDRRLDGVGLGRHRRHRR